MNTYWLRHYGFTLHEIGQHLGLTRQAVWYLTRKNPKKVEAAVKEMRRKGREE